jgi:hypothetical protein
MRVGAVLFLSMLAAVLSACVKPASEYPEAALQIYEPQSQADTKVASEDRATIRGIFRAGTLLGTPDLKTYVAAIDGKLDLTFETTAPIAIEPGPHALVIGYWRGSTQSPVAVRLEALPGKNYLVMQEDGELSLDLLRGPSRTNYLYIVDEATGETVVPKTPNQAEVAKEHYIEPTGAGTATIRGTVERRGFNEPYSAYVASVDGKYAPMVPETALSKPQTKYDGAVRLQPGKRAIGIGLQASSGRAVYAVLLDAKEGASYVLRQEFGLKRIENGKWQSFTVWIEEEKSGEIIWPKSDVPMSRLPF